MRRDGTWADISDDDQLGNSLDDPFEFISYTATEAGDYFLALREFRFLSPCSEKPDWLQMTVWSVSPLEHFSNERHIGNPQESRNPGMLSVGAAHWSGINQIEWFSSRGPTIDGRTKPDIVGADCGRAVSYPDDNNNGCWFGGTSQSAAHVTGLASLVLDRFPNYTAAQVATYLKDNARQRAAPDPNNTWGHGFASLPIADVTAPPSSPAIVGVTPATDSLTVFWSTPAQTGGRPVTSYDLRHIMTSADEVVDANWTMVENVWNGTGALAYRITGLATGTRYDVQLRAVNANGAGPWSAAATGTPAQWEAARSFSADSVGLGAEVLVTVTPAGYGGSGQVVETLPDGFRYVSSSLPESAVDLVGQVITFTLLGDTSFTYTATVPEAAGSYSFDGILRNLEGELILVGGDSIVTVGGPPSVDLAGNDALVRIDAPILVTTTFSEPVSGFTIDDITVANGVASSFAASDGDTVYTFDVTPNAIGEVTVDIPVGAAMDGDGNGNTSAPRLSLGIPYDDDGDGGISKAEAIAAIRDYFGGNINKAQAIAVIRLYFTSG